MRVEPRMPYRDDLDAATARRDALSRELEHVQQSLRDHEPLQRRAREITAELEEARRRIEHARARVSLPLLHSVTVSTPCKEPWERMTGDDRVRFCGRCEKNVFNLSAMTSDEAEALLSERGANMCARFYRRPDGTVLTTDCPVGARRRRRRRLVVTAVAVAAGAFGAAWALVPRDSPSPPPHEAIAGGIEMAQPPPGPTLQQLAAPESFEDVRGGIGFRPPPAPPTPPENLP